MKMNNLIKIENGQLAVETIDFIRETEKKMKDLKKQYDEFKAELLNAMENNGIKKFESDSLTITYVEAREDEKFDKDKFKEDMPELYDEYIKFSPVKSNIRIKVK